MSERIRIVDKMNDYIDRQAAIDALNALCVRECKYSKKTRLVICSSCELGGAFEVLDDFPSADVEEVRHGRWVEENPLDAPNCRLIKCSECGKSFIVPMNVPYEDWIDGRNYCYGCGARMDGEQDG